VLSAPCSQFAPGRDLPQGICATCGFQRRQHGGIPVTVNDDTPMILTPSRLEVAETERDRYKMILTEVGELFGKAAYEAHQMRFDKLPELVKELLAVKGFAAARLPFPPKAMPLPKQQQAFLDAVGVAGGKASLETFPKAYTESDDLAPALDAGLDIPTGEGPNPSPAEKRRI